MALVTYPLSSPSYVAFKVPLASFEAAWSSAHDCSRKNLGG